MEREELEKLFGPVIFKYTDRDAIEDGILVPVTVQDRVTRSVWEWLHEFTPMTAEPPSCWPVEMMGWFKAGAVTQKEALAMIAKHGKDAQQAYEKEIRDKKALALSLGLIGKERMRATRIYNNNEGGGILNIFADVDQAAKRILCLTERDAGHVKMWLIPNELGGVTLMFPEDY